MLISNESLRDLFNGFKTAFNQGFESARTFYREMAMIASSGAESETYAWLGQFPALREWIGDRQVPSLALHGYAIPNRKFESTIAVPRPKIEDDRYGVFTPFMQEMGRTTAKHPDELLFDLLKTGFTTTPRSLPVPLGSAVTPPSWPSGTTRSRTLPGPPITMEPSAIFRRSSLAGCRRA
jgi:phage major head subunit gpT-like protein